MTDVPPRVDAIRKELDNDVTDYQTKKREFDVARVHFEAARERLASTKRLAAEIMGDIQWYQWRAEHPTVSYAATPIGEAISDALADHAFDVAFRAAAGPDEEYRPFLTRDEITEALEQGGFDFRSSTPAREVHAALINLKGLTKDKYRDAYAIGEYADFLEIARDQLGIHPQPEEVPAEAK